MTSEHEHGALCTAEDILWTVEAGGDRAAGDIASVVKRIDIFMRPVIEGDIGEHRSR